MELLNVLNFNDNLNLDVLIKFVLIKKKCICFVGCRKMLMIKTIQYRKPEKSIKHFENICLTFTWSLLLILLFLLFLVTCIQNTIFLLIINFILYNCHTQTWIHRHTMLKTKTSLVKIVQNVNVLFSAFNVLWIHI